MSRFAFAAVLLSAWLPRATAPVPPPRPAPRSLASILARTGASALLVDVQTAATLDSFGPLDTPAPPGSTLKPLFLQAALSAGIVRPSDTISCRGTLQLGSHHLACTHPRTLVVLDAAAALPASCNTYFATLAQRLPPELLAATLRTYGLHSAAQLADPVRRQLVVLGIEGITVSPRQLAGAYRRLALHLQQSTPANAVVRTGLLQSVETGMAHAAQTPGLTLLGKTGSVDGGPNQRGFGWFAAIVSPSSPDARILVILLPGGNGNDAATLAHRILAPHEDLR